MLKKTVTFRVRGTVSCLPGVHGQTAPTSARRREPVHLLGSDREMFLRSKVQVLESS